MASSPAVAALDSDFVANLLIVLGAAWLFVAPLAAAEALLKLLGWLTKPGPKRPQTMMTERPLERWRADCQGRTPRYFATLDQAKRWVDRYWRPPVPVTVEDRSTGEQHKRKLFTWSLVRAADGTTAAEPAADGEYWWQKL